MSDDIAKHVKDFLVCGANPHTNSRARAQLAPLPIPSGPNQLVHVDLYGPLKTRQQGSKYVLVYTDAFSKMARLAAIKDKSARR